MMLVRAMMLPTQRRRVKTVTRMCLGLLRRHPHHPQSTWVTPSTQSLMRTTRSGCQVRLCGRYAFVVVECDSVFVCQTLKTL